MEKLDIHEFLRIYIPGLFLAFFGGRMLYGDGLQNAVVVTSAIFLGLAFSWFATAVAQRFFARISDGKHFGMEGMRTDFWHAWSGIVDRGDATPCESSDLRERVRSAAFSHYAGRYGSPELYGFRLPKTFGVLYFNVASAAAMLAAIPLLHESTGFAFAYHPLTARDWLDAVFLLAMSLVFGWISRDYFINSLRMELLYWKGLVAARARDSG